MKKLIVAVLLLVTPVGCGDHAATDPNCARIEAACAQATTPAQESCHEAAHSDNAATCAARLNECITTCGGNTDAGPSGG